MDSSIYYLSFLSFGSGKSGIDALITESDRTYLYIVSAIKDLSLHISIIVNIIVISINRAVSMKVMYN